MSAAYDTIDLDREDYDFEQGRQRKLDARDKQLDRMEVRLVRIESKLSRFLEWHGHDEEGKPKN